MLGEKGRGMSFFYLLRRENELCFVYVWTFFILKILKLKQKNKIKNQKWLKSYQSHIKNSVSLIGAVSSHPKPIGAVS